jgi:hypothetical protein
MGFGSLTRRLSLCFLCSAQPSRSQSIPFIHQCKSHQEMKFKALPRCKGAGCADSKRANTLCMRGNENGSSGLGDSRKSHTPTRLRSRSHKVSTTTVVRPRVKGILRTRIAPRSRVRRRTTSGQVRGYNYLLEG